MIICISFQADLSYFILVRQNIFEFHPGMETNNAYTETRKCHIEIRN